MARIRIFIARHLCTAPRPQKEAAALAAAGHDVTVHGVWWDPILVERDRTLMAGQPWRFESVVDCRPLSTSQRVRWIYHRSRHRFARTWYRRTRRLTADLFGYAHSALDACARQAPADLAIFHSEGGLWIADRLRKRGRKVGIDFEDWFSQDLPPEARHDRPAAELQQIERSLLRHAIYVLATSHAMAEALARDAGSPPPAVIYNAFPAETDAPSSAPQDRRDRAGVSLHWFSLVVGPDRGLETLAAALAHVPPGCEIHLRGDGSPAYREHWLTLIPTAHRSQVRFHPTVPNADLPARIAEHDIGLALDVSRIPSRNLTITNKLFQYLQGGLAIAASDTAGHREVFARSPGAGGLFPAEDAVALGALLREMVRDRIRLEQMKRAALDAARTTFAHERQASIYGERLAAALRTPAALVS